MASLQIYDPFAEAGFDDLFRGFFRPVRGTERGAPAAIKVDVTENEKGYVVQAEIPGVTRDEIQVAVAQMRKPPAVNQHVALIKHLEEEGDAIYHEAVGALFSGNPNPLDVIKWKEMYDTLEGAIDSCMGVAQVLQSISLKNA